MWSGLLTLQGALAGAGFPAGRRPHMADEKPPNGGPRARLLGCRQSGSVAGVSYRAARVAQMELQCRTAS